MSLPNPLPDNPNRWTGWKLYSSPNLYERLGLSFDSNASNEQIEDHCRQLLVWWQKKLPLKNQPSNPLAQLLRGGLDEAPGLLVEARATLLDVEGRKKHDAELRVQLVDDAIGEFRKLITFSLADNTLTADSEERLIAAGMNFGLTREETQAALDAELAEVGAKRVEAPPPPPPEVPKAASSTVSGPSSDPFTEFRRMLRLSKLCLEGDDMTDDQRDALCNMGESLGLTGGQAEDIIDEYLEETSAMPVLASAGAPASPRAAVAHKPLATVQPKAAPSVSRATQPSASPGPKSINISPAARAQERQAYANFKNSVGVEMLLVTSGTFLMGGAGRNAQANELPVTPVTLSRFLMSRFPITNAQFEKFDPTHASKRASWADDNHPVIYVSALDAERFCEWLSQVERRTYRLPTEAEWEYAARGLDTRIFPWGEDLDSGVYANFADSRTTFTWREPFIDDGFPNTSPVGSYPRGASPFGIEDMAGNVFEWCCDGLEPYKGKPVTNPRGPRNAPRRIHRGGSWKSRISSLRVAARAFNGPEFSSNDVGFRVVCECA